MRNNTGWNGWSSGYTYTIYSNTTNHPNHPNHPLNQMIQQVFEKSKYDLWVEALSKLLEEGYEIDIVTGGVINA
jgi:hypothetical protein